MLIKPMVGASPNSALVGALKRHYSCGVAVETTEKTHRGRKYQSYRLLLITPQTSTLGLSKLISTPKPKAQLSRPISTTIIIVVGSWSPSRRGPPPFISTTTDQSRTQSKARCSNTTCTLFTHTLILSGVGIINKDYCHLAWELLSSNGVGCS